MNSFARRVSANLAYWINQCQPQTEAAYAMLDAEWENLVQAVAFGLIEAETNTAAAELALQLGSYVDARARWGAWTPLLERVARGRESAPVLCCRALNRLGYFHQRMRRLPQARAFHEQAAQLAEAHGLPTELADATIGLGEVHFSQRELAQAGACARAGLALLEGEADNPKVRAGGLVLLGLLADHQGAYAEAEGWYLAAREVFQLANNPRREALVEHNLAVVFQAQGQPAAALAALQRAQALLDTHPDVWLQAMVHLTEGVVHFSGGEWGAAARAFLQVDQAALERAGHLEPLGHAANNLGNVALQERRWRDAADYLGYAVQVWREHGDAANLGNSLGDLGEALGRLGEGRRAQGHFAEARRLLESQPGSAWARRRLESLRAQEERALDGG
jgi:tetratricopeptide (TPR) repeat protein